MGVMISVFRLPQICQENVSLLGLITRLWRQWSLHSPPNSIAKRITRVSVIRKAFVSWEILEESSEHPKLLMEWHPIQMTDSRASFLVIYIA